MGNWNPQIGGLKLLEYCIIWILFNWNTPFEVENLGHSDKWRQGCARQTRLREPLPEENSLTENRYNAPEKKRV